MIAWLSDGTHQLTSRWNFMGGWAGQSKAGKPKRNSLADMVSRVTFTDCSKSILPTPTDLPSSVQNEIMCLVCCNISEQPIELNVVV